MCCAMRFYSSSMCRFSHSTLPARQSLLGHSLKNAGMCRAEASGSASAQESHVRPTFAACSRLDRFGAGAIPTCIIASRPRTITPHGRSKARAHFLPVEETVDGLDPRAKRALASILIQPAPGRERIGGDDRRITVLETLECGFRETANPIVTHLE